MVETVVAAVRAYNLTHDGQYFHRVLDASRDPLVALDRIPNLERSELRSLVASAAANGKGLSHGDRLAVAAVASRLEKLPNMAASAADPTLMSMAPVDEYFGPAKLSPLGIANELDRIKRYLDAGWGDRMAPDAAKLAGAFGDWQRWYPHDPVLPAHLADYYSILTRSGASATAAEVRELLLVQYAGTAQAQKILSP
jgi:hypothetical protein